MTDWQLFCVCSLVMSESGRVCELDVSGVRLDTTTVSSGAEVNARRVAAMGTG
jgi:hypothetical protein